MFTVVITEKEGAERRLSFSEPEVTVGRVPGNDVVLPKGNVSKRHSRIVLKDSRFIVVDLKSTNGTYVNGRKITSPLVVKEGDKIYVGDFVLTLESDAAGSVPSEAMRPPSVVPQGDEQAAINGAAINGRNGRTQLGAPAPTLEAGSQRTDENMPAVLRDDPDSRAGTGEILVDADPLSAGRITPSEELPLGSGRNNRTTLASGQVPLAAGSVVEPLRQRNGSGPGVTPAHGAHLDAPRATTSDLRTLLSSAAQELTRQAQLVSHDETMRRGELERALSAKVSELIAQGVLGRSVDRPALVGAALRELGGLGPLEPLLADPSVAHILVERFDRIFADRGPGLAHQHALAFATPESLLLATRRLLAQADVSPPLSASYDVILPSGLHVVCFLSATTDGPVLSLRRRVVRRGSTEELVELGWLEERQRTALDAAVRQHRNIWVVGPDGALHGRLLAALLGEVADDERVALCERVPEVSFEDRSCICLRLTPGTVGELLERARHARVRRLFLHDLREDDLKAALQALAKGPSGHVASFECPSVDQALFSLRRAGGIDATMRAVGIVVQLVPDAASGAKVTTVMEVELNDSSELALKPFTG